MKNNSTRLVPLDLMRNKPGGVVLAKRLNNLMDEVDREIVMRSDSSRRFSAVPLAIATAIATV